MGDNTRSGVVNASGVAGIVLYLFAGFIYFVSGLVVPEPWYWGVLGCGLPGSMCCSGCIEKREPGHRLFR